MGAAVVAAALSGALGVALWWRCNPSPCPYGQRFWVELPRPSITRERLSAALTPRAGERMLEVGPGTGYYTLEVARKLGGEGRLDILDVQQEMLDHTARRASEEGLGNIVPAQADARSLPYADDSFDAALICTALGEIPDVDAALGELRRVLRPGGRLVVGETYLDPHVVMPRDLETRAHRAGFTLERRARGLLGYFARLAA